MNVAVSYVPPVHEHVGSPRLPPSQAKRQSALWLSPAPTGVPLRGSEGWGSRAHFPYAARWGHPSACTPTRLQWDFRTPPPSLRTRGMIRPLISANLKVSAAGHSQVPSATRVGGGNVPARVPVLCRYVSCRYLLLVCDLSFLSVQGDPRYCQCESCFILILKEIRVH